MQLFVIICNIGMMINVEAKVKTWLIKAYFINDIFGKSCDVGKYWDYENCKCRKRLVDKLVDECDENIDEVVKILDNNKNKCNFCILYIVLFFKYFFTINVAVAAYIVYYKYRNCNKENVSIYDYVYQTKNH